MIRLRQNDGRDANVTLDVVPRPGMGILSSARAFALLNTATADALGHRSIDLDVFSSATSTTRHFRTVRELDAETMNARIWLGFHFRKAMTDGNRLGHEVSDRVIRRGF